MHAKSVRPVLPFAAAILILGALGTLAALLTGVGYSAAATRPREANETAKMVRWDIARCDSDSCVALVVGGHARWRSGSGATIRFTGTGQAEPREGEAAGGGVWIRKNSRGQVVRRGTYKVTGFISWNGFGGTLGNVQDGIGNRNEVRSGVLRLRIHLFALPNSKQPGVILRGRLVIASDSGGPLVPAKSHLVLHTGTGRKIIYREGKRVAKGQTLLHHLR